MVGEWTCQHYIMGGDKESKNTGGRNHRSETETLLKPGAIWWSFPGCRKREEILMWILTTPEQSYNYFIVHGN